MLTLFTDTAKPMIDDGAAGLLTVAIPCSVGVGGGQVRDSSWNWSE